MKTQKANLQDCHRALLADADMNGWACPSMITLRRHARAGLLNGCVSKSGQATGRTLYDVNLVLAHYLGYIKKADHSIGRQGAIQGAIESANLDTPMRATSAGAVADEMGTIALTQLLEKVISQFEGLQSRTEKMETQISEMHTALADLTWARKNLMSKYDAAYAAAVDRANRLEMTGPSPVRPETTAGLGQLEMSRLQNDVKIIKNSVQDLVGRLQNITMD